MKGKIAERMRLRAGRAQRVRRRVRGSAERPRLCVIKSNEHLHVQVIDDEAGVSLFGISTNSKVMRDAGHGRRGRAAARALGEHVVAKAKERKIERLVFDRGGSRYGGVLAELADAIREAGVQV